MYTREDFQDWDFADETFNDSVAREYFKSSAERIPLEERAQYRDLIKQLGINRHDRETQIAAFGTIEELSENSPENRAAILNRRILEFANEIKGGVSNKHRFFQSVVAVSPDIDTFLEQLETSKIKERSERTQVTVFNTIAERPETSSETRVAILNSHTLDFADQAVKGYRSSRQFFTSVAAVLPEQRDTYLEKLKQSRIEECTIDTQEAVFEAIAKLSENSPENRAAILEPQLLEAAKTIKGSYAQRWLLSGAASLPPGLRDGYLKEIEQSTIKGNRSNTQAAAFEAMARLPENSPETRAAILDPRFLEFANGIKGYDGRRSLLSSAASFPSELREGYLENLRRSKIQERNNDTQVAAFDALAEFSENAPTSHAAILDPQLLELAEEIGGPHVPYLLLSSAVSLSANERNEYVEALKQSGIKDRCADTQTAALLAITMLSENSPEQRAAILHPQNLEFADRDEMKGVAAQISFLKSVAALPLNQRDGFRKKLDTSWPTIKNFDVNTQSAVFTALSKKPESLSVFLNKGVQEFCQEINGAKAKSWFLESVATIPEKDRSAYGKELNTQRTMIQEWDGDRQATFFKLVCESPEQRKWLMSDRCVQYMNDALKPEQDDLRTFSESSPTAQQQRIDAVALQKYRQDGLPLSKIMKQHFANRGSAFFNAALGLHAEEERMELLDSSEMQSLAFPKKDPRSFGTRTRELFSSSSKEQERSLASYKGLYAHYYHSDDAQIREKAKNKLDDLANSALEPWRKGSKEQKQLERYIRGGLKGTTFAPNPENMPEGLVFDLPHDFFGQFNYLKEVNLSGTDLRKVEHLLHGLGELKDLKTLTMRGCQLTSFPEDIALPPRCDVDLSENPELPRSVLENLKRQGHLDKTFDRDALAASESFGDWAKDGAKEEKREDFHAKTAEHIEAINENLPVSAKLSLSAPSREERIRDLPPDFWHMVLHENLRKIDLSGHHLGAGKNPVDLSLIPLLAPNVTSVNLSGNGLTREKVAGLKQWSGNVWTNSEIDYKGKGKVRAIDDEGTEVETATVVSSMGEPDKRNLILTDNAFTHLPKDIEYVSSPWTVDMTNNKNLGTLAKVQSQLINFHNGTPSIMTEDPKAKDTGSVHSWKFKPETYGELKMIGDTFRGNRQKLQTLETELKTVLNPQDATEMEETIRRCHAREEIYATKEYATLLETLVRNNDRLGRYNSQSEMTVVSAFDSASALAKVLGRANVTMSTAPELQTKKKFAHRLSVATTLSAGLAGTAVSAHIPVPYASGLAGAAVTRAIMHGVNYPESRVDQLSAERTDTFIECSRRLVPPHERIPFARAMAMGMTLTMADQLTDSEKEIDPGTDRDKDTLKQVTGALKSGLGKVRRKPEEEKKDIVQQRSTRDTGYLVRDTAYGKALGFDDPDDPEFANFLKDKNNGTPQILNRALGWWSKGNNATGDQLEFKECYTLYTPSVNKQQASEAENNFLAELEKLRDKVRDVGRDKKLAELEKQLAQFLEPRDRQYHSQGTQTSDSLQRSGSQTPLRPSNTPTPHALPGAAQPLPTRTSTQMQTKGKGRGE